MEKKKKILFICAVIFFAIIIGFFLSLFVRSKKEHVNQNLPKEFDLVLNDTNIEVYQEVTYQDLVQKHDGKLLNATNLINTEELKKKTISLLFEYQGKKYSHDVIIEILDQKAPVILGSTSKTVPLGYEEDICDLFMIADNYDKNPTCSIEGKYDVNTVGAYSLVMNVADKTGNKYSQEFILKVKKKDNQQIEETEIVPVDFNSIIKKYKTNDTEIGIDISKWQKEVNMQKVKDSGVTFVIMRIGVHAGVGYDIQKDEYFDQNFKNAKEAGLKVGVYFYTTATTVREAKKHAKWVLEQLGDEKLDFPIAFDWENWSYWNQYNLNLYDINEIADAFIKVIENNGYKGMIYGSKYYLENVFYHRNKYPIWLAHYTINLVESSYEDDYMLWQLTDRARINGISDELVDVNVWYKN